MPEQFGQIQYVASYHMHWANYNNHSPRHCLKNLRTKTKNKPGETKESLGEKPSLLLHTLTGLAEFSNCSAEDLFGHSFGQVFDQGLSDPRIQLGRFHGDGKYRFTVLRGRKIQFYSSTGTTIEQHASKDYVFLGQPYLLSVLEFS